VRTPKGNKSHPAFTPDGAALVYYAQRGIGEWWRNNEVWIVPLGGGTAKSLTEGFDLNCSTATINDMLGLPAVQSPLFVDAGTRVLVPATEHGSTVIKSVSTDPRKRDVQEVIGGPGVVGSVSYPADGSCFAFTRTSMTDPGQVFVRAAGGGEERALTRVNRWLDRVDLGTVEALWVKGGSGNDVQGWVVTPPGFNPKKTYPSILQIHGGPLTQYGFAFMHEFFLLAASGYVVYFSNPRGGLGYGEEHAGSIFKDGWGTRDYEDLMAFTDRIAKRPYIDKQRMGVTGGSYGGYMTCWIVGHTDRFEAAVTQRCVSNLISMNGSSDFNWVFERVMGGASPWDDVESYWDRSPMKYVANVKTPTLVIHSEQDLRCAIEQGEQFYVALKRLGVPSEFVRFPDEPHGLSRAGRTDRRIRRLHHIVRWFDQYLKGRRKKKGR
jgi:dipeptidyl aminopeptidase/acylaminoacyl peptidase